MPTAATRPCHQKAKGGTRQERAMGSAPGNVKGKSFKHTKVAKANSMPRVVL